jgi:hypothetical protein
LRGVVVTEHGVHAPAGVFDVDRLVEDGEACLLQVLSDLGRISGEVKGCVQVHDGGVQDVSLWRRTVLLRHRRAFKRQARGARLASDAFDGAQLMREIILLRSPATVPEN